jgi:glycosyltransferase involved in cell wall biosynthesis
MPETRTVPREHVYLASNEWDGLWIIQQPIAREIGRDEPVLFVEQFVSLFTVLRYPSKWRRLFAWLRGARAVTGQVRVLAPLPLFHLGHRIPWLFNLELAIQRRWILWFARRLGGSRRVLWLDNPQYAAAIGRMHEDLVIYHVGDDIAAFETSHAPTMQALERRVLDAADLVFVAATHLAKPRRARNPNTFAIANAVDPAVYAGTLSEETAADLAKIPTPRIAFVGMVDHWVDVDGLASVIAALPDVHFAIVGPWRVDATPVQRLSNAHLLGYRPRTDVPGILRACHASIIPFKRVSLTEHIMPVKIYEALAAGIVPIATSFSTEVDALAGEGWVTVASSIEELVDSIRAAIAADTPEKRKRLSAYGLSQSWTDRWREMRCIIDRLEAQGRGEPSTHAVAAGAR